MIAPPSSALNQVTGSSEHQTLALPWAVSGIGHLLLFLAVVFMPRLAPEPSRPPSIINVTMVSLSELRSGAPAAQKPALPVPPESSPPAPAEAAPVKPVKPAAVPENAVSIAPVKAKPKPQVAPPKPERPPVFKKSLKKQTYKPAAAVQQAIEKIEENIETDRPAAVSDAINRLKAAAGGNEAIDRLKRQEAQAGGLGGDGAGRQALELEDIYRLEIAYQVNKNWAFSESLAGGHSELFAEVAFTVLPDGQIRDVWFDRRSGNSYLDDSAKRAVLKSNPLPPHPKGLVRPFVTVGLRFTPKGVLH